MSSAPRPLRRDGERNRQRVLAAARQLVADRGLDVTHHDIARAADVGVGTVYRRFPRKQDLVEALFRERVDTVVALAEQAQHAEDPWHGLEQFLAASLEAQAGDRGLRELLCGDLGDAQLARYAQTRIAPLVGELIARAQAAGQLLEGITPGDFVVVQLMVAAVIDAARTADPDLWRRALAIALTGLRTSHPLPGTAPDAAAIEKLLQRETAIAEPSRADS